MYYFVLLYLFSVVGSAGRIDDLTAFLADSCLPFPPACPWTQSQGLLPHPAPAGTSLRRTGDTAASLRLESDRPIGGKLVAESDIEQTIDCERKSQLSFD